MDNSTGTRNVGPSFGDVTRVERAVNMISADIGDETVVLNIETGYFLQLDRIASRIWTMLEAPITVAAMCERLVEAFDVSAPRCRADVRELLIQLHDSGVLMVTPGIGKA